jgi:hypothetical protein
VLDGVLVCEARQSRASRRQSRLNSTMSRALKRFLIVLVFACLPMASASGYFGLRAEAFYGCFCGGFQIGYDLQDSDGFGVRGSFTTLLLLNRFGLDAYWRVPVSDGESVYVGAGGSWLFGFLYNNVLELYGVVGIEFALSQSASFFIEGTLGTVLSGRRQYFELPPSNAPEPTLAGTITGSLGLGFNFRF